MFTSTYPAVDVWKVNQNDYDKLAHVLANKIWT